MFDVWLTLVVVAVTVIGFDMLLTRRHPNIPKMIVRR